MPLLLENTRFFDRKLSAPRLTIPRPRMVRPLIDRSFEVEREERDNSLRPLYSSFGLISDMRGFLKTLLFSL